MVAPCLVHLPMVMKYRRHVPLGTCTHPSYILDDRHYSRLVESYQYIIPEVAGGYWWIYGQGHGWGDMDTLVKFAGEHSKQVIYHCLRWWWDVQPEDPMAWITEAMTRYPTVIDWIVANECWWYDNPTIPLIDESFIQARKVRPDARLIYNGLCFQEYEQSQIKRMVDAGYVDMVGIQMHLSLVDGKITYNPTVLQRIAKAAGMSLPDDYQLDYGMYLFEPLVEWLVSRNIPWYISEFDLAIPDTTLASLMAQAEGYETALEFMIDHNGESFCMWGIDDGRSWLLNAHPLPFDAEYIPKPAWEVLE